MKKYVLLFLVVMSIGITTHLSAQCTVENVVISNVRTQISGTGTIVTIDVSFLASTNGGNKLVFFHVWKDFQYPSAKMHPAPYNCTGNQSVAPAPATFTQAQSTLDILDDAFINYGFNINDVLTTYSTTGIFTSYAGYDANVQLNYLGSTIKKQNISGTQDQVFIKDLTFTVPNYQPGDFLQVRAFNWATNGTDGKPQCWGCGQAFFIGDPVTTGSISCGVVSSSGSVTQPNYTIFIDSRYDDPLTTGIQTISGTYQLYIDADASGDINTGDVLAQTTTSFTTSLVGVPSGFNSRYAAFNQPFNNYTYSIGDPNSTKPVLALVQVTTTGYLGAGTLGNITNQCATLPVSLKNFNASQRNGKVALTWETDQENNNDGFDVQRRLGNGRYESIGFVDSKAPAGTGGAYTYSFDDHLSAANTVAYYRLRQLDLDGKSSYSEIKSVRNGAKQIAVSVYPNPSRGTTNVAIPEGVGMMDISLNDLTGKSVQCWNSVNMRSLQLSNLKPGIYMLRINFRESGGQVVERIVVQ